MRGHALKEINMNLFRSSAYGVAAAVLLAGQTARAVPAVSDVTFAQREGSRTVDITYTLTGGPAIITLGVETNGVALPDSEVTRLEGDVSALVPSGTGKRIVWRAGHDWPQHNVPDARARITAWATNAPPPYMVVDLNSGPGGSSYPLSWYPSAAALPYGGLTNDLYKTWLMAFRYIPRGTFWMGAVAYEPGYNGGREDLHQVTLTNDFYLGVYEVTQAQWYQVAGNRPAAWTYPFDWETRPVELVTYQQIRECSVSNNTDNAGIDWPATGETVDPNSFAGRLRARTGLSGFDLPTDAQWEYACRAGTARGLNISGGVNLTNSNSDANMDLAGRYRYNGGFIPYGDGQYTNTIDGFPVTQRPLTPASYATAKVGSYLPNAWGLYDMHGNVYEVVLDRLVDHLGTEPVTEPVGGSSGNRVLRSYSFYSLAGECRSSMRNTVGQSGSGTHIGFRLKCLWR